MLSLAAIGTCEVAERRPFVLKRELDDLAGGKVQRLNLFFAQLRCRCLRLQSHLMAYFIGIYIADSSNQLLVHQDSLN